MIRNLELTINYTDVLSDSVSSMIYESIDEISFRNSFKEYTI